jgi:hypothetical protein
MNNCIDLYEIPASVIHSYEINVFRILQDFDDISTATHHHHNSGHVVHSSATLVITKYMQQTFVLKYKNSSCFLVDAYITRH